MDRLIGKIKEMKNPTVLGLDPLLEYVPGYIKAQCFEKYGKSLKGAAHAVLAFNKGLIDAVYDIIPAVKLQIAYYEMLGSYGIAAFERTVRYAKKYGMFVISDAKRNDIGQTMNAYAAAHIGEVSVGGITYEPFGADAVTVNPYLGTDSIRPLVEICQLKDKGIFVLVKTSNESGGEIQDLEVCGNAADDSQKLYSKIGQMCEDWGTGMIGEYGYSAIGAVVGATYPEQLTQLREQMPHTMFLVPGYGAQGGGPKDIAGAFDSRGLGAIVNSSRGIMCAYIRNNGDERDYAKYARGEAFIMRDLITV